MTASLGAPYTIVVGDTEFTATHRVLVRTSGGTHRVPVMVDADGAGYGPAWTRSAWGRQKAAEFYRMPSGWIYVGPEPGIVVVPEAS